MSDTNVIGLGPNPLMSFGNTVAQPVPSSYRPVDRASPHTSGETGRNLGVSGSTLPRHTILTLGGFVGQPSQHLTPALLASHRLDASLERGGGGGGGLKWGASSHKP